MASAKSLEDMLLSSDIDESAVSALVGSLESQLSSSSTHYSRDGINTAPINSIHANSSLYLDRNTRTVDGQKHGVLLGSLLEQGNSATNSEKCISVTQYMGLVPQSSSLSSTTSIVSTGAVPASSYVNNVSSAQQALLNPSVLSKHAINSDMKLAHLTAPHFSTSAVITPVNPSVITTSHINRNNLKISALHNGNTNHTLNSPSQAMPTVAMTSGGPIKNGPPGVCQVICSTASAVYNITNAASQQACVPSGNEQNLIPHHPNVSNQQITQGPNVMSKQLNMGQVVHNTRQQSLLKDGHVQQTSHQSNSNIHGITVDRHVSSPVHSHYQILSAQPSIVSTKPNQVSRASEQNVNVMTQVVANQHLVPGIQIVNMNSARLGASNIHGAKSLSPRVVISNQVRIAPQLIRHGTPVQIPGQNAIAIPPGIRGPIFVKTENGQLQLLNVAPGMHSTSVSSALSGTTYRLQSVQPRPVGVMRALAPQQVSSASPVVASKQLYQGTRGQSPVTITSTVLQQTVSTMPLSSTRNSSPFQTPTQNATVNMSPDTVKEKCKNFLSKLIQLAGEQPKQVASNVKNLIQGLIDGVVDPEDFTVQLQKALDSSPQPHLAPFLKKSLPFLRQSLMTKEIRIDGIRTPPPPTPVTSIIVTPSSAPTQVCRTKTSIPSTVVSSVAGSALSTQLSQSTCRPLLPGQRLSSPYVPLSSVKQEVVGLTLSSTAAPSFTNLTPSRVTSATSYLQSKLAISRNNSLKATSSIKDREKRNFASVKDEDDINDVAAMGGVNLMEESQKILATNSEFIGAQIRSCKDDNILLCGSLQKRIIDIANHYGLSDVTNDVVSLVSHAAQERLKTLIEKLNIAAEHRMEILKTDSRYEVTQDVRMQIKFLEELDKLEKKKHEEQEREMLLRAAKSRSKLEDPEQLKLKQKAKEMQKAEIEELRQREANLTALLAIGPRKKMKSDCGSPSGSQLGLSNLSSSSNSITKTPLRPRIKRVNLRDLLFVLEQEHKSSVKSLLYKTYVK